MTDLFAEGSSDLAEVLLAGDYFFRASDADRMTRVAHDLMDARKHLLITGMFDGIVDHYGQILLKRLKTNPGLVVEMFLPSSIESMVERFNELLAQMDMEMARGERPSDAPNRVLVINDPQVLEGESWSLLTRMVTDFPGLNMRLIFLLDRLSVPVDRALDRFGSRLIRWEVAPPNDQEQIILRKTALGLGLEFQVERVLTRISKEIIRRLEPEVDLPKGSTERAAPTLDEAALDAVDEAASSPEAESLRVLFEDNTPKPKRGMGLFFRTLAILVLVVIGIVVFKPELLFDPKPSASIGPPSTSPVLDAAIRNQDSVLVSPPVTAASSTERPTEGLIADSASIPASDTPMPAPIETPVMAGPAIPDSPPESPVSEAASIPPVGSPVITPPAPEAPPPVIAPPVAPRPPVAPTPPVPPPAPEPATSALSELVASPDNLRVVQLIVLTSANAARQWIAERPAVSDAIIVPMNVGSRVMYAVVLGPFTTERAARETIQGKQVQVDYWIRSVGSLKQVLAGAN